MFKSKIRKTRSKQLNPPHDAMAWISQGSEEGLTSKCLKGINVRATSGAKTTVTLIAKLELDML